MKRFQPILYSFIIFTLFSGCSTVNHVNGTLIVGSWKFSEVMNFTRESSGGDSFLSTPKTNPDQSKSASPDEISKAIEIKKMMAAAAEDGNFTSFLSRYPDLITAVEFRQDKTSTITSQKITANGTWKINRAGTNIKFKENGTKKVTNLNLRSVDHTFLVLNDPVPEGTLVIRYKK